jgi:hypothetical protein
MHIYNHVIFATWHQYQIWASPHGFHSQWFGEQLFKLGALLWFACMAT